MKNGRRDGADPGMTADGTVVRHTRTGRPILRLPFTPPEAVCEGIAATGLLFLLGVLAAYWTSLPDVIPTHFGLNGEADAWGSTSHFLILPGIGLGLFILLTVVARFPHTGNYPWRITDENAERQYRLVRGMLCVLKAQMLWLFGFIQLATIRTATGESRGLGAWFVPLFLGLTLGTLAIYFFRSWKAR